MDIEEKYALYYYDTLHAFEIPLRFKEWNKIKGE